MRLGAVLLGGAAAVLVLSLAGAWLLSHRQSLLLNTLGLLCFIAMGGYLALIHYIQGSRYGPWVIDVYIGLGLMLFAAAVYAYQIIRRRRQKGQPL